MSEYIRADSFELYLLYSSYSRLELVMYIYIKSGSLPADQQCYLLPFANRETFKIEKRAAAGEIKKKLYRFPFESCCAFKVFSYRNQRNMFSYI